VRYFGARSSQIEHGALEGLIETIQEHGLVEDRAVATLVA
jgi:hypothetical protein